MNIRKNIETVRNIIEKKTGSLGIRYPITIVAVSKNMPPSFIIQAYSAGITHIGENRVKEADNKFNRIKDLQITKHMVGHLQGNKAGKAAEIFDLVQSLDSLETAEKLNKKCTALGKVMPVLLEINTSGEASKSGVTPKEAAGLASAITGLKFLDLSGLMTIGPLTDDKDAVRQSFRTLYTLRESLTDSIKGLRLPILSMGMSFDFEIAIEEGANMLRLGRIIFGDRPAA
jgi:hypothetical protein